MLMWNLLRDLIFAIKPQGIYPSDINEYDTFQFAQEGTQGVYQVLSSSSHQVLTDACITPTSTMIT